MVRTPILTCFGGIPGLIQAGFGRKRPDLHTAFLQPERLPRFVIECPPAMRILDLIVPYPGGSFQSATCIATGDRSPFLMLLSVPPAW